MRKLNMNTINQNAPIGIFDSGVGGLTVFDALKTVLPNESFVYLADLARIPYGTKGVKTIVHYAEQIADYLIKHYCIKALVIACNTATAHALVSLQAKWPQIPIMGVIEPGAMTSISYTKNQHIGVIATEGTVKSHAYKTTITRMAPQIHVSEIACSLLVSLVEEGWLRDPITDQIIRRYLEPLFFKQDIKKPDTLILGCTHFPLLKSRISACLNEAITIIDSANTVAHYAHHVLLQKQLLAIDPSKPSQQFLVTDSIDRFLLSADRFLKTSIFQHEVRHVDLNCK